MNNSGNKISIVWSVAEPFRGSYCPNQYTDVMLPMTVLRRLDCVVVPDSSLRDYENVPLKEDIQEYMKHEVLPHAPSVWVDEINLKRYFYQYVPPRPLEDIEADLKGIVEEIVGMLSEVTR